MTRLCGIHRIVPADHSACEVRLTADLGGHGCVFTNLTAGICRQCFATEVL